MKISSHTLRSVYGIVSGIDRRGPGPRRALGHARHRFARVAPRCSGLWWPPHEDSTPTTITTATMIATSPAISCFQVIRSLQLVATIAAEPRV